MPRKIVQISYSESTEDNELYALDNEGQVWRYIPERRETERVPDGIGPKRDENGNLVYKTVKEAHWHPLVGLPS